MNILTIVLFILTAALFSTQIKTYNKSLAYLLSLAAGIIVFIFLLQYLQDIFTTWKDFLEETGIQSSIYQPLIKGTGIALVVKIASAICKDAGEQALAYKMELAGTTAIVLTALPLFSQVIHLIMEII